MEDQYCNSYCDYSSPSYYEPSYKSDSDEPAHEKSILESMYDDIAAAFLKAHEEFVKHAELLIKKMKQPNSSVEVTTALQKVIDDFGKHGVLLIEKLEQPDFPVEATIALYLAIEENRREAKFLVDKLEQPNSSLDSFVGAQIMLEIKDAEIGDEVSKEHSLEEPPEILIMHNMCEEKIQEEESEVEVEEVNHDILVEKTRDPEMDKYTGLHSCIDMSKLAPSDSLPSSIVKQLILESKSIPDHMDISLLVTKTLRSFKGMKLHGHQRNFISTARGFIIKSFDPDGAKNKFILLLQSPSNKPWDPGVCCNTLSVTCSSCFKQWDPGGSF